MRRSNLGISHVFEVDRLASLVATEPGLLEVIIQLLDDVLALLLQLWNTLGLVQAEDLLVHLRPELDTAGGQLVDGLTHLGADSDDTASWALVCLLPLGVINTLSIDNGLLGHLRCVGFLGDHHTAAKEHTIEWHWRVAEFAVPRYR